MTASDLKRRIAARATAIVAVAVMLLTAASCSTTRRIADDDQLYTGIKKIAYNTDSGTVFPSGVKTDIHDAVFVKPNNYWSLLGWRYPFPLGLWVYNNWPNPKTGLRHGLYEKLVEEPVLMSDVRPQVRTHMIEQILDNNGYLRGTSTYSLVSGKNPKKAQVLYNVNPGPAFCIHRVQLLPDTTRHNSLIASLARQIPYLQPGSRYSPDSLAAGRVSITTSLRNRGYYFFRPEYIEYLADSFAHPGSIELRMTLGSNIPKKLLEPYRTGRVNVYVYRNNRQAKRIDTIPAE